MEELPQDNNKEVPTISVVDITENEDGSANISFEVSDDFIETTDQGFKIAMIALFPALSVFSPWQRILWKYQCQCSLCYY